VLISEKNAKIILARRPWALIVKALLEGLPEMSVSAASRILLCAADSSAWDDVRPLLEEAGHSIGIHQPNSRDPEHLPDYSLILLQGTGPEELQFCRRLRLLLADSFIPILYVTGEGQPTSRAESLEAGVDAYLQRPFAPRELLAQVQAFLRIKELHDRLLEKTAEINLINKRLELAHKKVDQELELARRIQQSFLPQTMPDVPHARLAVLYLPCGRVGGDFYDAFRLDENHFGFYVADAMGHGVPASLLTIFLKRGVRAKEIIGKEYRLVPPNEVLQRLNRDLVEQSLADNPFITMVYALFNHRDRKLRYSRAGHPYPLHIPAQGRPELWKCEGSLLGIVETEYELQERTLDPGDKVLFYTDGLDGCTYENLPAGKESLLACAARNQSEPVAEFLDRLSNELVPQPDQPDDLTLLALEVTE
jgi:sigma-B regulation protein RsbU (phosphoserine phosphatase)